MSTLSNLIEIIESKQLSIEDKNHLKLIKKYFNDLKIKHKNSISRKFISHWNEIKFKISDVESLDILQSFLDIKKEYNIHRITIAGKYEFDYITYGLLLGKKNIRQENIFKLNCNTIVKKLTKYFSNTDIQIKFEKPTTIDKKIKIAKATYKHDVIIELKPKTLNEEDDDKTYEFVLEYFERVHNKFNDEDKRISTNLFSDAYYVYNENNNNMEEFMIDTIYSIIEFICAANNDCYELSKMLYFNKNYKSKSYKKDIEYFNKIIEIKKTDNFDFKNFYDKIQPINPETGDNYEYDEFIEFVENTYNIKINNKNNSYLFEELIVNLDLNIDSDGELSRYKNIYIKVINTLFLASQKIIDIISQQRAKRLQLPEFIKNIQKFHKDNLKIYF